MFFLLYFGLSNAWHVRSVLFSFSSDWLFFFGALLCFLPETQKIVAAPPKKRGTHGGKRNKVFLHFPPFCVALRPPHTASAASSKREKERERVMKSQSDCFFSFSLSFSPLPMEEAFKREEKGRGDRGRKEEKEAL